MRFLREEEEFFEAFFHHEGLAQDIAIREVKRSTYQALFA